MGHNRPVLTFGLDCDLVVVLLQVYLTRESFLVVSSFELHSACSSLSDLACPHHPREVCECRLVILAVYRDDIGSFPLVLHGHGDETEIGNIGARPLPISLERCLENAWHDERVLKDSLINEKSV
jgi:hypothetical protein